MLSLERIFLFLIILSVISPVVYSTVVTPSFQLPWGSSVLGWYKLNFSSADVPQDFTFVIIRFKYFTDNLNFWAFQDPEAKTSPPKHTRWLPSLGHTVSLSFLYSPRRQPVIQVLQTSFRNEHSWGQEWAQLKWALLATGRGEGDQPVSGLNGSLKLTYLAPKTSSLSWRCLSWAGVSCPWHINPLLTRTPSHSTPCQT